MVVGVHLELELRDRVSEGPRVRLVGLPGCQRLHVDKVVGAELSGATSPRSDVGGGPDRNSPALPPTTARWFYALDLVVGRTLVVRSFPLPLHQAKCYHFVPIERSFALKNVQC